MLAGPDQPDIADSAFIHQRHRAHVERLEVAAIGDHQLAVGGTGRGDHAFAFGAVERHGFLAEDVLARRKGLLRPLGMQSARQNDIDRIDPVIGGDLVEIVIGVARIRRHAIGVPDPVCLVGIARDDRRDMGAPGVHEVGHHLIQREAAKSDDCDADAVSGPFLGRGIRQANIARHGLADGANAGPVRCLRASAAKERHGGRHAGKLEETSAVLIKAGHAELSFLSGASGRFSTSIATEKSRLSPGFSACRPVSTVWSISNAPLIWDTGSKQKKGALGGI